MSKNNKHVSLVLLHSIFSVTIMNKPEVTDVFRVVAVLPSCYQSDIH